MGSGATSRFGIEYPLATDAFNPNGDLQAAMGDIDGLMFSLSVVNKSANYAATIGQLVKMTGAHTVTSPAAGANVMWGAYNAGTGTVTLAPASGVLNLPGNYGTASVTLPNQGDFAVFVCDGTDHNLIAGSAPPLAMSTVPRVSTLTAAGGLYSPDCSTTDLAIINDPAANFTVTNPSGTPGDGQKLLLRIASGTTGYTPTWGAAYASSGAAALPGSALPASKTCTFGFVYDANRSLWVLLAADTAGY